MMNAGKQLLVACYRKLTDTTVDGGYGLSEVNKYPALIESAIDSLAFENIKHPNVSREQVKEAFNRPSFQNYVSEAKKTATFTRFEDVNGSYPDLLARLSGYANFQDFIHRYTVLPNDEVLKTLRKIFGNQWVDLKSNTLLRNFAEFEDLEFNHKGIRTSCISYSLLWARQYIPTKVREIQRTKNKYRYILTDKAGQPNLDLLQDELDAIPELKNYVSIKSLKDFPNLGGFNDLNMLFPICNDIVVYEKLNDSGRFEYHTTVIGVNTNENDNFKSFVVEIDKDRGHAIRLWFNKVWAEIP